MWKAIDLEDGTEVAWNSFQVRFGRPLRREPLNDYYRSTSHRLKATVEGTTSPGSTGRRTRSPQEDGAFGGLGGATMSRLMVSIFDRSV